MVLRDAPDAIRSRRVEALIVDQAEFAGGSVAEYLGLPFVTAILTLPLNLHWSSPFRGIPDQSQMNARFAGKSYSANPQPDLAQFNILASINRERSRWGLRPIAGLDSCNSELAQVAQVPACFDLPECKPPSCFHYTGPFCDHASRREVSFPWEQLDESRPLVFVSMGTLQERD